MQNPLVRCVCSTSTRHEASVAAARDGAVAGDDDDEEEEEEEEEGLGFRV